MRRFVSGKWLRCGYTTGSCAAGAAKAATIMALTGRDLSTVVMTTPDGQNLSLDVVAPIHGDGWASCAVRKDGGDDPDATDGALIYARVEVSHDGQITIDGGPGVGRVTKPGLDQPVGAAAINTVPRQMIKRGVLEGWEQVTSGTPKPVRDGETDDDTPDRMDDVLDRGDGASRPAISPGLTVSISCPTGETIATKTFNPKLGIVGGISILGTTGIVEPMSNAALIETTAREISILAADGIRDLVIVVGNYGQSFATTGLGLDLSPSPVAGRGEQADAEASRRPDASGQRGTVGDERAVALATNPSPPRYGWVKSSNFIGDAITSAAQCGVRRVLVVGHLGKMSKLGIGMLNTHSSVGDGRIETLIACALEAGADLDLLRTLLECVSTDAVVNALVEAGVLESTMTVLARRIQDTFDRRTPGRSIDVSEAQPPIGSHPPRPTKPSPAGEEPVDVRLEWVCFTGVNGQYTTVAQSAGAPALITEWSQS
jgi:cobalt-precorrin-5B (C1)-methyltransferase